MKIHVAFALADAMLSGKPTPASMRSRCAKALGGTTPWLPSLCRRVAQRHDLSWRPNEREAVAQSVLEDAGFLQAWNSSAPPAIRFYFLLRPALGLRPLNLEHCALPDLPTAGDIAHWLKIKPRQLDWYADLRGWNTTARDERLQHYTFRWLPKRRGGHRLLEVPKARLKAMQRKLLDNLLDHVPCHAAAHGFRHRRSCVTNARAHVGQQVVIRMDLQEFFASISGARVQGVFRMLGYPENAARILAGLCVARTPTRAFSRDPAKYDFELPKPDWLTRKRLQSPHLPQGAPTSPALANLCAFNLDMRLHAAAEALGARYTRYADDMTFSGGTLLARSAGRFIGLATRIVQEEGYALNVRKTCVMRSGRRQQVTGLVVNDKVGLPRHERDALKATLHNCLRFGPATQNRLAVPDFRAHLEGRVARVLAIDEVRGARLKAMLQRITWQEVRPA